MVVAKAHIHERTCMHCRQKAPKEQLLRFVRDTSGNVHVDSSGRMPGRGAYVCSARCVQSLHPGRLQYALKSKTSDENFAALMEAAYMYFKVASGQ